MGDYTHKYGPGRDEDDGSSLTWLWVIITLALLAFCGWFVWRVMKSRKRLREEGGGEYNKA